MSNTKLEDVDPIELAFGCAGLIALGTFVAGVAMTAVWALWKFGCWLWS